MYAYLALSPSTSFACHTVKSVLPVPTPVIMPVLNECKANRTEKKEEGQTK